MSSGRIAAWTWGLIFGGMLVMAIGLTVRDTDNTLGWVLIAGSGIGIALGVILIWVRSRMNNTE
jgi:cyanate permease